MASNPDFRDLLSAFSAEGVEFILTSIAGLDFDAAFRNRTHSAYEGVPIFLPSRDDLIAAKRACGRKQDLLDVERMEQT